LEDSDNGVRSALGAGIRAVVVTVNDYTRDQDFTGASLVVDRLGEPGASPRVLSGLLYDVALIDVPLLRKLHGMAHRGG
jgi:hypothetical protein